MEIGSRVGRYEIVSPIGKGGMGEVWRAIDTSLDREVALKVLPTAFTEDGERRARFEREAKLLASLNHPNIATLYGLEEIDGRHLLVMEFIKGEDLAECLARGPMPWSEARDVAVQIAQALATAHEHGIIHRDLKPANVRLRPDGTAKVLDFGLAKIREGSESGVDLTRSPTLTGRATTGGAILGTVGYMSPEQARGRAVGRQADIWAFGCMLHEMVTGRRLFDGDTASDVLAGVLRSEIDFETLPTDTSPAMRRLLKRCLQRETSHRLHDFGDVLLELEDEDEELVPAPSTGARRPLASRMAWVVAAVACSAALAFGWLYIGTDRHEVVIRTEIAQPGTAEFRFQGDVGSPPVVAPDGSAIIFGAAAPGEPVTLWVRSLRTGEARQLAGTEGGFAPIWSPDAQSIAFFDYSHLKRLDLDGGSPLNLCPAGSLARGGVWTEDDHIIFAPRFNTSLHKISAAGGDPTELTTLIEGRHTSHRWPVLVPDQRHLVYLAINHNTPASPENELRIVALDGTGDVPLLPSVANGAALGDRLLYLRESTLMARPFDAASGRLTGEAQIVANNVFFDGDTWRAAFSAATDLLVYHTVPADSGTQIDLLDLSGREIGQIGDIEEYNDVAVSPDRQHLAVSIGAPSDLWIMELDSGLRRRLTFAPGAEASPAWSADGKTIFYRAWTADNPARIMVVPSSGAGDPRVIFEDPELLLEPSEVTPDGRYLLLDALLAEAEGDLWRMDLTGDGPPVRITEEPRAQNQSSVSPDGRWIAYSSNESGLFRIFVEPFLSSTIPSQRTGRWEISDTVASVPRWSAEGRTLVYLSFDGRLMATEIDGTGEEIRIGETRTIARTTASGSYDSFDTIPGTDRLVVVNRTAQARTPITVISGLEHLLRESE
jgi:Tol biopolymer transport system component/predicted Ser/Thr protein kinase